MKTVKSAFTIPPSLLETAKAKAREQGMNYSEFVVYCIKTVINGNVHESGNNPGLPDSLTHELSSLRSMVEDISGRLVALERPVRPKPEHTQITITPPEPEDQGEEPKPDQDKDKDQEQGEEPARPVFEYKNGKVSIPVVRDYLTYHIRKYQEATGVNDMFIVKKALGGKKSLLSSIVAGSKSYKQISKAEFDALEALVIRREEKSSPEGT